MMNRKVAAIGRMLIAIIVVIIIIIAGVGVYAATLPRTTTTPSTSSATSTSSSSLTTTSSSSLSSSTVAPVNSTSTGSTSAASIQIALVGPAQMVELPIYVALDQGFFKQNGLTVSLLQESGAPPLFAALTSKSVQFALFGWTDVVTLWQRGEPVQSLYALSDSGTFTLLAKNGSSVNSLADLQGKNVGVAAPDLTQFLVQLVLNSSGYNPNTYVHFVYVGLGGQAQAALDSGSAAAALQFDPITTELTANGTDKIVYDMRTSAIAAIPAPTLVGLSNYISQNPAITQAVVKSLQEASQFIHSNQSGTLQIMLKTYQGTPQSVLQSMYQTYLPTFPVNGTAPLSVYKNAWNLDVIGGVVNATSSFQAAYQATVNTQYIK